MTSNIFGRSIEFTNHQSYFEILNFIIIVTIFNEITFVLIENLHFLITDYRFGNIEYDNYEVYKNITEIGNNIIDSLQRDIQLAILF